MIGGWGYLGSGVCGLGRFSCLFFVWVFFTVVWFCYFVFIFVGFFWGGRGRTNFDSAASTSFFSDWWHVYLYAAKVVPQQITHTSPRIQSDYTAERSNLIPLSSHRASPNPVAMETRNDNRWGNNISMNKGVRVVSEYLCCLCGLWYPREQVLRKNW